MKVETAIWLFYWAKTLIAEVVNLPNDKDYFLYWGPVSRAGYIQLTSLISNKTDRKKHASLVLITTGGDPDAGFRMGRALGHYYEDGFDVFVPDICKSAGTLICLAANNLVISDRGELGPLDIQLSKPDEMFENGSGLDIIQSLSALRQANLEAFREYLVDVRVNGGISTKMAADIATKLAAGLIAPIASQVDPIRWGEHQRAIYIAHSYGARLSQKFSNLKAGKLNELVSSYPCHSFVIDRKEASSIFNRVREPLGVEIALSHMLYQQIDRNETKSEPTVIDLEDTINQTRENVQEGDSDNEHVSDVRGEERESSSTDAEAKQLDDDRSGQNNQNCPKGAA